jgi:thiamine-phosphate pyrophosphorylase
MENDRHLALIVISSETVFAGEATALNRLFERGMNLLHLRKPQASEKDLHTLLSQIDERFHERIVLHDRFSLLDTFRLRGVHLNRRNPVRPERKGLFVSRSCHSLEELKTAGEYDCVFLSPVFDSISKAGYLHAFSRETLLSAKAAGWINRKVIALGGISPDTLPLAAAYGFGGVAVLGALWGDFPKDHDMNALTRRFDRLCAGQMNGLLFITHRTERYDYLQSVAIALEGGCRRIQLRMKEASPAEVEKTALRAMALCEPYGAELYIDDHVEVCLKVCAKGVHLGKTDMPPRDARRMLGRDFIIGGTANTFDDIRRLHSEGVDYIGLGPFRFTATKKNLSPVIGLDGYRRMIVQCREQSIRLPVFAIGGIAPENIPALIQAGVSGIALSSAILQAQNPVEETGRIITMLRNPPPSGVSGTALSSAILQAQNPVEKDNHDE